MRVRIELFERAGGEVAVSGWAAFSPGENGLASLVLDHEYPDRRPAPGWLADWGAGVWHVAAAEGRSLAITAVTGEAVAHPNTPSEA